MTDSQDLPFSTIAAFSGIKIFASEVVPEGHVLFMDDVFYAHPGYIQSLLWRDEIRSIVQRGLKAAFPDLIIPRRERHA